MTKINNSVNYISGNLTTTIAISGYTFPLNKVYTTTMSTSAQSLSVAYRDIQGLEATINKGIYQIDIDINEDISTTTSCASSNSSYYALFYNGQNTFIDGTEKKLTQITSITSPTSANNYGINSRKNHLSWILENTVDNAMIVLKGKIENPVISPNILQKCEVINSIDSTSNIYPFDFACSSNGQYVYVANYDFRVESSSNYGITWNNRQAMQGVYRIACSSDGSKVYAVQNFDGSIANGSLWISSDYGVNWTQKTSMGAKRWCGIACSSDGTKVVASATSSGALSDYIYISTDSGANWTQQTSAGLKTWDSICCSSDFTKIYATNKDDGYLTYSTNSGSTWTSIDKSFSNYQGLLKCSSDGTKIINFETIVGPGSLKISTDSGSNWSTIHASAGLFCCSSDCSTIYFNKGRSIYTSYDYGATWIQKDFTNILSKFGNSTYFQAMGCSSTGDYIYIGEMYDGVNFYGHLFESHRYGGFIVKSTSDSKTAMNIKFLG